MTRHTPEARAHAIGLALAQGADKAHEATGIPRRTISSWLARERPAPELDALVAANRQDTLETLKAAAAEGAASLLSILRDPKTAARDRVRAAEVALDRWQLMSGGVTGRTANLNANVTWATPEYEAADDDTKEEADALLKGLLNEVMFGQAALRMAGATGMGNGVEIHGLNARAKLDDAGVEKVRRLLSQFERAQEAGVSATEIMETLLYRKQIGPGHE